MLSRNGGYSPLSYHCGSVWSHDTAGLVAGTETFSAGIDASGRAYLRGTSLARSA